MEICIMAMAPRRLKDVSEYYNYTFDIGYAENGGAAGFVDATGIWRGSLGEVYDRTADVAFGTVITLDRYSVVDPTASLTWFTRDFIIRTPMARTSWEAIAWPLSKAVWAWFLLSIIATIPIFYIFQLKEGDQPKGQIKTWDKAVGLIYRIIFEQSVKMYGSGIRLRVLIYVWIIACLIIATGYRCKLVSFLTFLEPEEVPSTHEELSLSDYTIYFRNYAGAAYKTIKDSRDPIRRRLVSKMKLVNSSYQCVVLAALHDRTACMDYWTSTEISITANATLFAHREQSIFLKSKDSDSAAIGVWAFRKGSPLTETFDQIVLWSLAYGMFDYHRKADFQNNRIQGVKWIKSSQGTLMREKITSIYDGESAGPRSLSITSLTGILLLLILGLGFATVTWIVERQACSRQVG